MHLTVETNDKAILKRPGMLQEVAQLAMEKVTATIARPVHGEYANVIKKGDDLQLKGCCDELLKAVFAKIKD